jgi:hypothetical protein
MLKHTVGTVTVTGVVAVVVGVVAVVVGVPVGCPSGAIFKHGSGLGGIPSFVALLEAAGWVSLFASVDLPPQAARLDAASPLADNASATNRARRARMVALSSSSDCVMRQLPKFQPTSSR